MKLKVILILLSLIINSCGGGVSSGEVVPDYIDENKYNNLSCKKIIFKIEDLNNKINIAQKAVDTKKQTQSNKNIASFLFFWPALFITDDNSVEAKNYAHMKGEYEALIRVFKMKQCS